MRSALYAGNSTIVVEDRPPIAPGPGQVQIAVAYTGICGTDLHILHGAMDHRVHTPQPIGHEMSGRIAALGPGVEDLTVGQPVTVMPLDWCGTCPACHAGHSHICHRLNFIGIDTAGAMQQRWNVAAKVVVALPPELPLSYAALVEPTAVAVHDVRRAGLQSGESAVVIGGGPVGVLIGLVARSAGAQVTILELDAHRRAVAEGLGLRTLDPAKQDVAAEVDAWTSHAGVAVAFEVSGSASGVDTAVQLLAVRGRLVVVGLHNQRREVDLFRFFWRELTMIGARVYERRDYDTAIDLLTRGIVPADALISRIEPLDNAAAAFDALRRGGNVMKVLIDCQEATA
ncbi:MAG: alcohol dehydrogenase catalytic domain-containing protein [Hamadaea sp.]|uniref:zinc-dependent alcohol dehydrogenase n=1 Tax=Hamadaea sp. TaxID=2024425 RepID=UPI0018352447|nr:alcohol dehydrogenase catalytic domain-containing protein [Hamadaea sp.]NUR69231.1 alcohol dehydrogenase catalytic domain-containing protein [Hamadaea sp.]NUT21093.1 alcohol dehydrogenase catalytic domain-containing protein [Hamadaea sp.]